MLVLAIDTALEACSAALFDAAQETVLTSETSAMTRGHAESLIPLIASVMKQAAVDFRALDRIAVTVGPGSFTGLRVGVAAARGLSLATGKPAIGITTLSALAAPYLDADAQTPVAAAIDGRHRHVYLQLFGPHGRVLIGPRMMPIAEAAHAAASASARIVGSGAPLLAEVWPSGEGPPSTDPRPAPDVDWVARLGARADADNAPARPLYLRPPDVHPQSAAILPRR